MAIELCQPIRRFPARRREPERIYTGERKSAGTKAPERGVHGQTLADRRWPSKQSGQSFRSATQECPDGYWRWCWSA
ncbi:hypothetical protein WMW72_14750 [Paenibacillus filicis]|uniref:Uncharacterized protein n=1 Tax=Paenibacillus filicis TaxID=669464 RepID=A0ABU9DLR8_9BACL